MIDNSNNGILHSINEILDKTDPTQKALALLASLVDTSFNNFREENNIQFENMMIRYEEIVKDNEINKIKLETVINRKLCPLSNDVKYNELEKRLKFILFFTEHPIITTIVIVGIFSILGLGADKLFELIGIIK